MIEIKAPHQVPEDHPFAQLFLAGSIEMGLAQEWQYMVVQELADKDVTILNPRRDDWDKSWVQSIDNPQFKEQVDWELNGLNWSDMIFFYFDPATKSPITLMELGMVAAHYAGYNSVIVVCPEGFWRKGNVDVICDYYGIPVYSTLAEGVAELKAQLT